MRENITNHLSAARYNFACFYRLLFFQCFGTISECNKFGSRSGPTLCGARFWSKLFENKSIEQTTWERISQITCLLQGIILHVFVGCYFFSFSRIFQEPYQSANMFGSRSGPTLCGARFWSKLFENKSIEQTTWERISQITCLLQGIILHVFVGCYFFSFSRIFQEPYQSANMFGSRSGPTLCGARSGSKLFAIDFTSRQRVEPDLGPNCL